MPNIYLAGPMSGYPKLNHKAFFENAEALTEGGWNVFNPAAHDVGVYGSAEATQKAMDEDKATTLRQLLNVDLRWITSEADAIAMMPGWERSYGAKAEHATAVALGLQIIYL